MPLNHMVFLAWDLRIYPGVTDPTRPEPSGGAPAMPEPSPTQPPAWEPSPSSHPEPVPLISESDLVNPLLTVADVMTAGPRTCSPFSSAVEAALVFRDADCGVIPVVDAGKPVGVLTDRDLALALAE